MSLPTLSDIILKTRRLTGAATNFQLTDTAIEGYINSFYLYDLPAQFRSLKLKDKYTFDTVQGIDTYAFDSQQYITIEQPVYCAKREIALFNDPWNFYGVNFNWQSLEFFSAGDGTAGPYSGFAQGTPIIRSVNNIPTNLNYPASRVQNILITVNTSTGTLNVTDDGNGNLIGDVAGGPVPIVPGSSGTINYFTGQISGLIFSQGVPAGNQIQIQYNPVVPAIPLSILFFQNQFTLRPVPDRGYTIEMTAYRAPTQALLSTGGQAGNPELSEWWELIAVGAAKKIYEERLDLDGINLMDKMLTERYQVAYTRTYAQLGKQQCRTLFVDQLTYSYGAGPGTLGSV